MEDSSKVSIKAPDIAENGAVVPIKVSVEGAANVESITILVEGNATPLIANFRLDPVTEADVSTRIKMGKTSNVVAVVKADGKVLSAKKEVKVTIGGCGG
jgi:sulfur-oxidizing protein SoxY